MILRTELHQKVSTWNVELNHPILTAGSCFAQSIGDKFVQNKFKTIVNPFGTTYHPLCIHKLLNYSAWQESPAEHTYLENEGLTFNYDFHSRYSSSTPEILQKQIGEAIGSIHYFLKDCKVLILTYGTAWIYERADTGESVANCHKMPANLFSKRLSSVDEMCESFRATLSLLRTIQPTLKVILTVSPVRHIKDSLQLNSVSKSILRLACHQITQEHADVDYFPAYEIMMDDLRDYRFYKDDLIHPSEMAENYIWEKFISQYCSPAAKSFIHSWEEIRQALSHRPFHSDSQAHQNFLAETLKKLMELKPQVDVDKEIMLVQTKISESQTSIPQN